MIVLTETIGYFTSLEEALSSDKIVKYVIGKDGVFEIQENEIGVFIVKTSHIRGVENAPRELNIFDKTYLLKSDGLYGKNNFGVYSKMTRIMGLDVIEESVTLKLPKIPKKLFYQIYALFKRMCFKHSVEVLVEIWFNKQTNEYFLECPEQKVFGTKLTYSKNKDLLLNPNFILVMDIHSHNKMDAFFSKTDDTDETETRLYGVVGRLDKPSVTALFRVGVNGSFLSVKNTDLFDENLYFKQLMETFPEEWMDKIVVNEVPPLNLSQHIEMAKAKQSLFNLSIQNQKQIVIEGVE